MFINFDCNSFSFQKIYILIHDVCFVRVYVVIQNRTYLNCVRGYNVSFVYILEIYINKIMVDCHANF